jgi:hypothetical protein
MRYERKNALVAGNNIKMPKTSDKNPGVSKRAPAPRMRTPSIISLVGTLPCATANGDHESQGVEKADGSAHLDNGVELGDGCHDKKQKQDHALTLVSK